MFGPVFRLVSRPMSRFGLVRPVAAAAALLAMPAAAQMSTVDPNTAMQRQQVPAGGSSYDNAPAPVDESSGGTTPENDLPPVPHAAASGHAVDATADQATYQDDDIFGAAEGVFGKGAQGLAKMIESILKKQGRPNAYIDGREASGAFVAGLRYGSGTLHHKVEGDSPVYWTGPSVGFDFGGNGAKTFVLVYNLYDTNELFKRFPAAEGDVYVIGGLTASYMRRGDVVLIPIRLGVGWRLGANVGYMRFSKKAKWVPF